MDDLYRPTLDTVEDVEAWFASWNAKGGVPHPDDRAWETCSSLIVRGFAEYHAKHTSHDEGGHLGLYGPAAPQTKADAVAYDAAMDRAHDIVNAAGGDIYEMAYLAGKAVVVTYVRVTTYDDQPLDPADVALSIEAALNEIVVGVGATAHPVQPKVEIIDGPDLS